MQLSQFFQRHFVTTQAKNLMLSNHTCFLPLYLTGEDSKLKQSRQANETSEMNATSFRATEIVLGDEQSLGCREVIALFCFKAHFRPTPSFKQQLIKESE